MTSRPTDCAAGTPVPAALPGASPEVLGNTPSLPAAHLPGREGAQTPGTQGGGEPTRVPGRTFTLELPAGLQVLSLNDRHHWSQKSRRAAELKKAAWAMALKNRLPHLGRVSLVVEYQPPDKRHRDADNIPAASGKHVIDGIVAAGVIPDDESPRYVADIRYRLGPVYPLGRLVLHITEVAP